MGPDADVMTPATPQLDTSLRGPGIAVEVQVTVPELGAQRVIDSTHTSDKTAGTGECIRWLLAFLADQQSR